MGDLKSVNIRTQMGLSSTLIHQAFVDNSISCFGFFYELYNHFYYFDNFLKRFHTLFNKPSLCFHTQVHLHIYTRLLTNF